MGSRARIVGRRLAVAVVVATQLFFVARGYWSAHKEFAFQMFPESSTWQANIVRVTATGDQIPISEPWSGYAWNDLVTSRALQSPWVRHHADAGVDNQLAFLRSALQWVADHTPRDHQTRYLEATVTYWHNLDPPRVVVLRSGEREMGRSIAGLSPSVMGVGGSRRGSSPSVTGVGGSRRGSSPSVMGQPW